MDLKSCDVCGERVPHVVETHVASATGGMGEFVTHCVDCNPGTNR